MPVILRALRNKLRLHATPALAQAFALVTDLQITHDNQYWVATTRGIVRFHTGPLPPTHALPAFELYPPSSDGYFPRVAETLFEDRSGTIWAGTDAGLYRLSRTRSNFEPVEIGLRNDKGEGLVVHFILEDSHLQKVTP